MDADQQPIITASGRYGSGSVPEGIQYVIVHTTDASRLVAAVEAMIQRGFIPLGGHSALGPAGWYQSMVRGK